MSAATLLVTGATGFIGSAVAAELLEHARGVEPLFLVRADSRPAGLQRLRAALHRLDVSAEALGRLDEDMIVCGDLASFAQRLGDSRVRGTRAVLNIGALASFAWKNEVWVVNVEDTSAFARAAAKLPHLRRFVHVGTAMISGRVRGRLVHEAELRAAEPQFVPYTRSKCEIERRLPALLDGVPLVIARPSIVVGHTRVGCRPSPSIFWLFRAINAARRIPFPADNRIDVVPVDYCARALLHLTTKTALAHARYHVSAGERASCTFADIDAAYCAARGESHAAPLEEFDVDDLRLYRPRFAEWFGGCDADQIANAVRIYSAFAALDVRFDNTRLLAEDFDAPPRFTDYLPVCARTAHGEPVGRQMAYDFR